MVSVLGSWHRVPKILVISKAIKILVASFVLIYLVFDPNSCYTAPETLVISWAIGVSWSNEVTLGVLQDEGWSPVRTSHN